MATLAWIVIVIVIAVLAVAVAAALVARQRGRAGLRDRFGPEYDRTVKSAKDQRAAETELLNRERQRARLDIRPLSGAARARYAAQWRVIQERFVDEPVGAASSADTLVHQAMAERGYPIGDFSAQSDLVSVDYPQTAESYRVAHAICERARSGQASTEELRVMLLQYRSLFGELLGDEADTARTNGAAQASSPAMEPAASDQSIPVHQGTVHGPADRETGNDRH